MALPDFSFSDAEVRPRRTTEIPDSGTSDVFRRLKRKHGLLNAESLASHVGFEDNDLKWEGVRPLGQGAFGRVGLWVAKDKNGVIVKVSDGKAIVDQRLTGSGSRRQTVQMVGRGKAHVRCKHSFGSLDPETIESIPMFEYFAARKLQDLS
jgi:hypothetical protein